MKPVAATVERLTRAKEGRSFAERDGRIHVVRAKCATGKEGRWYCITHRQAFDNQMQKDGHIHLGKHCLVWWCCDHGCYEVP